MRLAPAATLAAVALTALACNIADPPSPCREGVEPSLVGGFVVAVTWSPGCLVRAVEVSAPLQAGAALPYPLTTYYREFSFARLDAGTGNSISPAVPYEAMEWLRPEASPGPPPPLARGRAYRVILMVDSAGGAYTLERANGVVSIPLPTRAAGAAPAAGTHVLLSVDGAAPPVEPLPNVVRVYAETLFVDVGARTYATRGRYGEDVNRFAAFERARSDPYQLAGTDSVYLPIYAGALTEGYGRYRGDTLVVTRDAHACAEWGPCPEVRYLRR